MMSQIPSDSTHFSKQCLWDEKWGMNTPVLIDPILSPTSCFSSLLLPWVPAFFVHPGRVPCFHQRGSEAGDLYWRRQDVIQRCSEKKWCQSVGLAHCHKTSFNHQHCFLLYIHPVLCVTLQPLSCSPYSFVYTSSSLDFKLFEGRDLFLLIILSPTMPLGVQSMPDDLNWQWMRKEIWRAFSPITRQEVQSLSSVTPDFVMFPSVAGR